ncbi:ester cyclase [Haloarcula onubensis]|uniref:Ester cyclase n=1 Tax=Haloarcula onubensis TaxID=2950539 RepID=A0ABU2FQU7_9EURY|nr:ester cyclase [Halomicroarcula sp. S3CR25-11]MDS0283140.1 ester cyclase [Halomicroarcula sp. S3CR25-11]
MAATEHRHKENFRRLMAETHEGNLGIVDELVDENVVTHGFFGMDATDREGYKAFFEGFGAAFADQEFVVEDLVAEDDLLVVHFSIAAVHRGEILGIEPTGRELSWTGTAVDRYEDGRIVEAWLYPDSVAILDQLGALPEGVGY